MARDEFKKSVLNLLRQRVGSRCSNPDCRVQTTGPVKDGDGVNNIGVAAHITAASKGGPRFCGEISSTARSSFDNAIWLCQNCAKKIDRDESTYTVDLLRSWKRNAELAAENELGKKLPGESDAMRLVTTALAGTGLPLDLVPSAISNVHKATVAAIEAKDTRFNVKTTYQNGETHIHLTPRSKLEFKLNVLPESVDEFSRKYDKLVETGESLEIGLENIRFEGLALFEDISKLNVGGNLRIESTKRPVIMKLEVKDLNSQNSFQFEEFRGDLVSGNKSYQFSGEACDGILSLSYNQAFDSTSVQLSMSIDRGQWIGRDVRSLPYLAKLSILFQKLANDSTMRLSLEEKGEVVISGNAHQVSRSEFVLRSYKFFQYVGAVKRVADFMNMSIKFQLGSATSDQVLALHEAVEIIEGRCVFRKENLAKPVTFSVIADSKLNNVSLLKEAIEPYELMIEENEGEEVSLMGQVVRLPKKKTHFFGVVPKILTKDNEIVPGGQVLVELVQKDNFKIEIRYP